MFADDTLSSKAVFAPLSSAAKQPGPNGLLIDYELGGVAVQDPSQGLELKVWTLKGVQNKDTGLVSVVLSASGVTPSTLFSGLGITEVSLAFDQNMRPFVAYMQNGVAKYYWYDPTAANYVTNTMDAGVTNPRCTLDDHRDFNLTNSDIILGYIRAGNLCFRKQRDRYQTEYVLCAAGADAQLVSVGMNEVLRLQFRMRNFTASTTDQMAVNVAPFLGDVVLSICGLANISPEYVDVSELYNDTVPGLKIDVDQGFDKPIDWLREIFLFDKSDYDRKIHFPKRGRQVVARIPYNDLVQGDPQALNQVLADQKKLPRIVNINHLDPDAGLAKNKQTAERRSNVVETNVTKTIDSQVVLTVDQAATSVMTRLKVYWNELISFKFSTSLKYTHLVVSDVIEVQDSLGTWNRMRLTDRNEDTGIIKWDAEQDAGDLTYTTQRVGNTLPTPISTSPGLIGETQLEIISCSPIRDSNDELGLYIAACGSSSAWTGYQLLYSIDGGLSYMEAFRASTPSLIGETETDLPAEADVEYPADQSVEVLTNYPLSSITYAQMLVGMNLCCIGDEMFQFLTATSLGTVGVKYRYKLTGLVRGRFNTKALFWPMGTRFVHMDSSVIFAPVPRSMIGYGITYKAVSFGLTEDETVPTEYVFDDPQSQLEWPVINVEAVRSGADCVVSWMGRMRLGTDTTPYNSKYFRGYKVKFSDGYAVTVTDETFTRASIPEGLTVQVCATNEITGEGPWSTAISA